MAETTSGCCAAAVGPTTLSAADSADHSGMQRCRHPPPQQPLGVTSHVPLLRIGHDCLSIVVDFLGPSTSARSLGLACRSLEQDVVSTSDVWHELALEHRTMFVTRTAADATHDAGSLPDDKDERHVQPLAAQTNWKRLIADSARRRYRRLLWDETAAEFVPMHADDAAASTQRGGAADEAAVGSTGVSSTVGQRIITGASSLSTGLWRALTRLVGRGVKAQRHGLLLGLDAGGKTTMTYMLDRERQGVPSLTTLRWSEPEKLHYLNWTFVSWDLGGVRQARWFHSSILPSLPPVDGIVFVVDANDWERIEEARAEFRDILPLVNPALDAPVLVLANKQDLPRAMPVEGVACELRVGDWPRNETLSTRRRVLVQGVSVVRNKGVLSGLDWLIAAADSR